MYLGVMLRRLRIQNLAVVEELSWELGKGFNALTGETGAGKSILVDAFLLLLGVGGSGEISRVVRGKGN